MEKSKEYERADIELVYFDSRDVLTTSGALGETEGGSGNWDSNGWT